MEALLLAEKLLRCPGDDAAYYPHVRPGLCAAGTSTIISSGWPHGGPDKVDGFSDASLEERQHMERNLYSALPVVKEHVARKGRMTPSRMSFFCTLTTADDEVWHHPLGTTSISMFGRPNSTSKQNREEVTRDVLGMHAGLAACYIRLFAAGYGDELTGFLDRGTDK